jgi:hypothetical protein
VFVDKEISSRKRWRQAQVIVDHVWKRWLKEYVPNLLERRKWNTQHRNVKTGDLVLVVDKDAPRGKPIVGDLGVVRAAEVQTKNGKHGNRGRIRGRQCPVRTRINNVNLV